MTPDQIREALTEAPSPEAQERHLEQIREALDLNLRERLDNQAEEIDELRRGMSALAARIRDLEIHKGELRWHADVTNERLTHLETQEKAVERDEYVDLRRALLVIGLTPILAEWHHPEWDEPHRWEAACAEFHRRYGHLTAAGKPLWSKPPAPPSPETKAEIAEALRRRQEA